MKLIPLTQGKFAKVDDDDYERVKLHLWNARLMYKDKYYAVTTVYKNADNGLQIYLQNFIITGGICLGSDKIISFADDDSLNCQKENLVFRNTNSKAQGIFFSKANKTSQYVGVYLHRKTGKWGSSIRLKGILYFLGLFINEEDAAKAYNEKALELYGERARFNKFTNALNQQSAN